MRRGLTMIELLLALSLLAVLMVAVASWIQVTVRAGASMAEPARWRGAAQTVFRLIHDDLVTGDLGTAARQKHVEIIDRVLVVHTRARVSDDFTGPIAHRYKLDAPSHRLQLEQRLANGRQATRHLLNDVGEWNCSIDIDQNTLTVTVSPRAGVGEPISRRYKLP